MPENLLAIDAGTQSIRALLFDPQGNLVAKQRVPIEPYFSTAPGLAEQYPEVYRDQMANACRGLFQQDPAYAVSLAAVAITTQRGTVLNLDHSGQPLRPAIVWLDQRRTEGQPALGGLWGAAFRLAGASQTVAYIQAEAESNWIRTYQPEVWAATHKYLFLSGYLNYVLTGDFVDSVGCQVGYVPFDYKNQTWSGRTDWKWQAVPMPREFLPRLVPQGQPLGQVTAQAAALTGIPAGLPVIASAADKACEVLGAGCLEPHQGCLSYGTTATINTTHQKYLEAIPLIPPYPAAEPHAYNLEIQIYRGYWMVSWFKQEFGQREEKLALERGLEPEDLFDELVETIPPGSQGLVLQPYWSPGLRMPGPEARGAVIGFSDCHTRAHLYRAILEGLAYALREGKERTEQRSHVPITELRVAGGGSQSRAALQLTADIFNLPVSRPHVYEASGLGAAMDAAVGAGVHPNFSSARAAMTRIKDTFAPQAEAAALYDDLYHSIYRKMYPRLQSLYQDLRRIMPHPI